MLCGAIFDAPGKKSQLAKTEEQITDPDFWNQPEKSQKIMQDRKRLEEQSLADEAEVARLTSDLDTLFELAREGEDVTGDLERELKLFSERLEVLETGMLLSGRNDSRKRDSDHSSRRGRYREPGLGGDAAAHVSALGGAARLRDRGYRPAGGRGRGHQIR